MHPISFDDISYLRGEDRVFLVSGEIHYFRVPYTQWRDRLEKFIASGGNCVATYVPWLLHEPEEGSFNFSDPQLDIEGFLDLCREMDLWAIVRPGPYQYSELVYNGLPTWLCENYPEIYARRLDGTAFNSSAISYLHPTFLAKTHRWYQKIIPRLARHDVAHAGAVVCAQVDNELMGIHEWRGTWDYNRETMGIGKEHGRWPDFLRARYGNLDAVNTAYDLTAANLAEVLPIGWGTPNSTVAERRRIKDYEECYFTAIGEYARLLTDWMHEGGLHVPIVHNSANPTMNAYFLETVKQQETPFLLGSDHYYNLDQNWQQNNPTPQYASEVFGSLEMLRHMGMPPTVFELPGGSLADFPPITAHDALACYATNIAYGMKGFNYYIFAGGYNYPGSGLTGEVYDFGAAISPDGEMRELYGAQRTLNEFLHAHEWLVSAQRQGDCHLGHVWEYARSRFYDNEGLGGSFSNYDAHRFARQGLFMSASCASLSPVTVDITSDAFIHDTQTPLMLATSNCLSHDSQQRLVKFLEAGGKLLLAPVLPTLDENFNPCSVLVDYLGSVQQQQIPRISPNLTAFGVPNVFVNGGLYATTERPTGAVVTAQEERGGHEIGWRYSLPSGGVISVLGFHWLQAKREHEAMLRNALQELGIVPIVQCDNPNLWTSLLSDGEHAMLFVLNLFTAPMAAHIRYRYPATGKTIDLGTLTIPGITVQAWSEDGQLL